MQLLALTLQLKLLYVLWNSMQTNYSMEYVQLLHNTHETFTMHYDVLRSQKFAENEEHYDYESN
jgi:hypothetical protein